MNTELDPAGQAAFLEALAEKSGSGGLRGDYTHADAQYVVRQDWDAYTPNEHALWRRLYARQARLLPGRAADVYIDSLAKLPLLHGTETRWPSWCAGDAGETPLRGAFIDDSAALLSATIEGLGFAILRWTLAAAELQAGRVALASERVLPYRLAYYFVCPEAYLSLPKVVALRDWLVSQGQQFAPPRQSG